MSNKDHALTALLIWLGCTPYVMKFLVPVDIPVLVIWAGGIVVGWGLCRAFGEPV